jgi:NADH-quinone oxidoreductase subunit J
MEGALFYIFSAVAVLSALMVIVRRNPVHSALFLVLTFFCVAGIYLLLHAQFIAAIQIIVYAGAIMVLFLFVIMLLNLREGSRSSGGHTLQGVTGILVGLALFYSLAVVVTGSFLPGMKGSYPAAEVEAAGHTRVVAKLLFTEFLLPFEVTSVLLLVAIIGAVVLARRRT